MDIIQNTFDGLQCAFECPVFLGLLCFALRHLWLKNIAKYLGQCCFKRRVIQCNLICLFIIVIMCNFYIVYNCAQKRLKLLSVNTSLFFATIK